MDKIWDGKSFKVGGHWPLWWEWKKPNGHAEPTKKKKKILCYEVNTVFGAL